MALAAGCGGPGKPSAPGESNARLKVAVTIRALELIVMDLIPEEDRDRFEISVVVPDTATPHGYEPPPSQVAVLVQAQVIVSNGLGLDDWATRGSGAGQVLVRFADVPGAAAEEAKEADPHPADQHHHSLDQHLWFDPTLVGEFAGRISTALARQLATRNPSPGLEQRFKTTLQQFLAGTREVQQEFETRLAPFRGQRVIVFHDALHRICARHGIVIGAVLRPIDEAEPSPSDLRTAIDQVRSFGVKAVFVEPQFSPQAALRIAEATGAKMVSVDPHGVRARSWRAMMESVLAAMVEALGG